MQYCLLLDLPACTKWWKIFSRWKECTFSIRWSSNIIPASLKFKIYSRQKWNEIKQPVDESSMIGRRLNYKLSSQLDGDIKMSRISFISYQRSELSKQPHVAAPPDVPCQARSFRETLIFLKCEIHSFSIFTGFNCKVGSFSRSGDPLRIIRLLLKSSWTMTTEDILKKI